MHVGDLVHLGADVTDQGRRSLTVQTTVLVEQGGVGTMRTVTTGRFVMVEVS